MDTKADEIRKTVRKTINKAFLKEPLERGSFTLFKDALEKLLADVELGKEKNEHEVHFKNFLAPFFRKLESDTTALEDEIDRLVYELYGLSEEEIGVVRGAGMSIQILINQRQNVVR